MKKVIAIYLFVFAFAVNASAQITFDDFKESFVEFVNDYNVDFRVGYNIGAITPLGMPATIRGLNSYNPQFNPQFGADMELPYDDTWGLTLGVRLQRKGMKTDAKVKGYHMEMVKGGEAIEGYFTGSVLTKAATWSLSVPVQANYWVNNILKLRAGPYFGLNLGRSFKGYAYDGYLRKDQPTGERIELGKTSEERGEYDFGGEMRWLNWGLAFGADYYIRNGWGVYAELQWGLNGAFKSRFKTVEQKMYPIYGTIGIMKGF